MQCGWLLILIYFDVASKKDLKYGSIEQREEAELLVLQTQKPVYDDQLQAYTLDFDGRVNSRSCELLLQYLTAPYLRIPLVLRFFAAPEMTTALANEQLQDMLDAVMFEPGAWQPNEEVACPEQVRTI